LLAEYSVTIPQGIRNIRTRLPEILEDAGIALPGLLRQLLRQLGERLRTLDQLVDEMDRQIQQWHRSNEASQRLTEIAGVGPITATAMVASIARVARENGVNANQVFQWRYEYRNDAGWTKQLRPGLLPVTIGIQT
jgi:transposase